MATRLPRRDNCLSNISRFFFPSTNRCDGVKGFDDNPGRLLWPYLHFLDLQKVSPQKTKEGQEGSQCGRRRQQGDQVCVSIDEAVGKSS